MTGSRTIHPQRKPETYYDDQLRSALRLAAAELRRQAEAWAQPADNVHVAPTVHQWADMSAKAFAAAARIVEADLAALERTGETERPYTTGELLYAVTRGDAESYIEGIENPDHLDEKAVPPRRVMIFGMLLKHVIDQDGGWGERLQACLEEAYRQFTEDEDEGAAAVMQGPDGAPVELTEAQVRALGGTP